MRRVGPIKQPSWRPMVLHQRQPLEQLRRCRRVIHIVMGTPPKLSQEVLFALASVVKTVVDYPADTFKAGDESRMDMRIRTRIARVALAMPAVYRLSAWGACPATKVRQALNLLFVEWVLVVPRSIPFLPLRH